VTFREDALRQAITFRGTTEQPPGSNRGPEIDKWNRDAGAPAGSYWCCSFQHGMFKLAGFNLPGGASVGQLLSIATTKGWRVDRPLRGDLVCFEFGEGAYAYDDHIGIVERVLALRWNGNVFAGWIRTIEGNTSAQANLTDSQSNGGGVFGRTRWIRSPIGARFVRVPG
jgi:hypothetical protein